MRRQEHSSVSYVSSGASREGAAGVKDSMKVTTEAEDEESITQTVTRHITFSLASSAPHPHHAPSSPSGTTSSVDLDPSSDMSLSSDTFTAYMQHTRQQQRQHGQQGKGVKRGGGSLRGGDAKRRRSGEGRVSSADSACADDEFALMLFGDTAFAV